MSKDQSFQWLKQQQFQVQMLTYQISTSWSEQFQSMGCMQSKTIVKTQTIQQRTVQVLNRLTSNPTSDPNAVQTAGEYQKNIGELSNALKLLMSRIEQQDLLINKLTNQKSKICQIPIESQYQKLENIGAKTIKQYKILCRDCYPKCQRFTQLKKGLQLCIFCSGYGVRRSKTANIKCSKCGEKNYSSTPLEICQDCYGRGAVLE